MVDFRENREAWLAGTGSKEQRRCSAMQKLGEKYIPIMERASGHTFLADRRETATRAALARMEGCAAAAPSSVFRKPIASSSPTTPRADYSGNLSYYEPLLDQAIASWNGSSDLGSDFEALVYAMPLQYPLTGDDSDWLASKVNLAASSGADAPQNNFTDYYETGWSSPASIFRAARRLPMWKWLHHALKIVIADVNGWAAGAAADSLAHPNDSGWEHAQAGLFGGILGSGTMTDHCLDNDPECS